MGGKYGNMQIIWLHQTKDFASVRRPSLVSYFLLAKTPSGNINECKNRTLNFNSFRSSYLFDRHKRFKQIDWIFTYI